MYKKSVFLFCIIFSLAFTACNLTRNVPDGKYLLIKNEIRPDSSALSKESFEPYIKQKTNRKILGLFRFHLGVYNLGNSGKDSKFKRWLRSIGEEPVILDSEATAKTKDQFRLYLNKKGFFNAVVSDSIKFEKKKATALYYIHFDEPYKIHNISYSTLDTGITKMVNTFQRTSLLIPEQRYDEEVMDKERERITMNIRDQGYYFFNRNYITYGIDTSAGNHHSDIYLYVNRINENVNPSYVNNNGIENHQPYHIHNIYIQTDYNPKNPALSAPKDTLFYNGIYILSASDKKIIRNSELIRNIFVKSGDLYYQEKTDFTYRKLQDLNIFKFINMSFTEVPRDSTGAPFLLDLNIQLTPVDKQDVTLESEVTNTGGNLGIAGTLGFRNKNVFHGAEVLQLSVKGGLEAIPNFNDSIETKRFFFFNTYEIGPELSLDFKRFLLPGNIERRTSRYQNPHEKISAGFNYQERPDYRRSLINFTNSYSTSPTKSQRVIISIPEISSVKVQLSPAFEKKLQELNDPRLFYAYDTHFISCVRGTFITTNQNLSIAKDFFFLRLNGEFAFKLVDESLKPFRYYKSDFDFSFHHYVNQYNNVVWRLAAGAGIPYGSSTALPFEKSFFAGGANSVRAWSARTLGPGSYKKTVNIEESGDIKIEANIEYRSEFLRLSNGVILEGAAFIDAGNVWTRNEDISRPGGKFVPDQALKELGVGAGAGLRFNFSFFILRLDGAVKLRDPSLDEDVRWVYPNQKFVIGDITTSLAIGYPF